jgi:hypothetical protein
MTDPRPQHLQNFALSGAGTLGAPHKSHLEAGWGCFGRNRGALRRNHGRVPGAYATRLLAVGPPGLERGYPVSWGRGEMGGCCEWEWEWERERRGSKAFEGRGCFADHRCTLRERNGFSHKDTKAQRLRAAVPSPQVRFHKRGYEAKASLGRTLSA